MVIMSFWQPSNISYGMAEILAGRETERSCLQPEKIYNPRLVTLSGILIFVMWVQAPKAKSPMLEMLFGRTTLVIELALAEFKLNALGPMAVTG